MHPQGNRGMTATARPDSSTIPCEQPRCDRPAALSEHEASPALLTSPAAGRSAYLAAASACLPRWLRIVGPSPWLDGAHGQPARNSPTVLYRTQAATLAIGGFVELEHPRANDGYLRECVRTSLIRWQLSLRADGRPADQRARRSPLTAAAAGYVVQLLSDAAGFQTRALLADLTNHLAWLLRRDPTRPWLEASLIAAAAEGALLVRDASLLNHARTRLAGLLARQDEEGWFPERGGVDLGRLSLTVDALARVFRHHGWPELDDPLRRALRFLLACSRPDGGVGGDFGSWSATYISPYGVELLAPVHPEATALAARLRQKWAGVAAQRFAVSQDDLCAVLGATLVLAAGCASAKAAPATSIPQDTSRRINFPRAGLTIVRTDAYHAIVNARQGGGLHVSWSNTQRCLDDAGITVVFPSETRSSGRPDRRTRCFAAEASVTTIGILKKRRPVPPRLAWLRLLRRVFRRRPEHRTTRDAARIWEAIRDPRSGSPEESPARGGRGKRGPDLYKREITFGPDWIRLRDEILCHNPCEAIVCQSPMPAGGGPALVDSIGPDLARPPLFVEGGCHVEVDRLYRQGRLIEKNVRSAPSRYCPPPTGH